MVQEDLEISHEGPGEEAWVEVSRRKPWQEAAGTRRGGKKGRGAELPLVAEALYIYNQGLHVDAIMMVNSNLKTDVGVRATVMQLGV